MRAGVVPHATDAGARLFDEGDAMQRNSNSFSPGGSGVINPDRRNTYWKTGNGEREVGETQNRTNQNRTNEKYVAFHSISLVAIKADARTMTFNPGISILASKLGSILHLDYLGQRLPVNLSAPVTSRRMPILVS